MRIVYSISRVSLFPLAFGLRLAGRIFARKKTGQAIVVFYTGKLGDMVCLTPVLEALKSNDKEKKLIVFARSKFLDIWLGNPYIDEKIGFANEQEAGSFKWIIRQWRRLSCLDVTAYFNLVNNFEGAIFGLTLNADRSYLVTTRLDGRLLRRLYRFYQTKEYKFDRSIKEFYFEFLEQAGFTIGNKSNQLYFPGNYKEVEDFFRQRPLAGRKIIGLIVSSGKDYKVWPRNYWLELIRKLQAEYQPLFLIFGLKEEKEYLEEIRREVDGEIFLILDRPLNILPHYLKSCNLFVSVDTGLMYIADALKVPVVDILGPCDDNNQRPENNYCLVTDRAVCRPQCKMLYSAEINLDEVKTCFLALTPEMVFSACQELLSR